ncbi:MAG: CHAT domain-containing protein [Actinobacteria bacterium]|nr:CHAT domain-containing protein [Actinomycetota bacterium]MBI3685968.1 CHAT domain-containing protein [Actinomycetota bacterium]
MTATELADEAHRMIGVAPRRALRLADDAIRAAGAANDLPTRAQALRARGRAHRELGDLDRALSELRQSVRVAESARSTAVASQARMSLAYVLLERGHTTRALRSAEQAVHGLRGTAAAHALMQQGLLYQRCGRATEALDCYRRALPVLRRAGDRLHEAKAYNNRGLLQLYRGRLAEAETDIRRAAALYTELGQELLAADAEWNLGFVAGRQGDVPGALRLFDTCETAYRDAGVPAPELLVTRAELLLSVGLRREARHTVEQAMTELAHAGMPVMLAEALLLSAQAALADGDTGAAADHAARAVRLFTRQHRPGWTALARYVGLRAEERDGRMTPSLRQRSLRSARELAALGWRAQELDARVIAARVALERGALGTARRELAAAGRARRSGPLELRMRAWYAQALLRLAEQDRIGAGRALTAGIRVLDEHRAMVGVTELRMHMAGHGQELTELGLLLARESGSAQRMLAWAERGRARGLWPHPIRPPQDPTLAALLAELRQVTSELEASMLGGSGVTGVTGVTGGSADASARTRPGRARMAARRVALEDQVRRRARGAGAGLYGAPPTPPRLAELQQVLRERVLVEIVSSAGALHAVTVRDGIARLRRLGDPRTVARLTESLLFALRRLAVGHGGTAARSATWAVADRTATRLSAELLRPVADLVGDRPLVLVPPAELQALPWSMLPDCRDRAVTVAPSAAIWLRASTAGPQPRDDRGRVLLVAGPGLPGAEAEIADLAAAYGEALGLTGRRATVANTLVGLDGAAIGHIAAHGRVRSDNPLFSALDLADGPLTVYDLERLSQPPELVLLPACQSGIGQALAGDELMGWTAALFALGTRTVVATVIPVPDQTTRRLMVALHERLRGGSSPAAALQLARTAVSDDPAERATAAAFVCFGAG